MPWRFATANPGSLAHSQEDQELTETPAVQPAALPWCMILHPQTNDRPKAPHRRAHGAPRRQAAPGVPCCARRPAQIGAPAARDSTPLGRRDVATLYGLGWARFSLGACQQAKKGG